MNTVSSWSRDRLKLAFAEQFIEPILSGEKYITFRYGLDINGISPGDRLVMVEAESRDEFARATINCIGDVDVAYAASVEEGHRSYENTGEFLDQFQQYYPQAELTPETPLTEVHWTDVSPVDEFDQGPIRRRPSELDNNRVSKGSPPMEPDRF